LELLADYFTGNPKVKFLPSIDREPSPRYVVLEQNATDATTSYNEALSFVQSISRCLAKGELRPRLPDKQDESGSQNCDDFGYLPPHGPDVVPIVIGVVVSIAVVIIFVLAVWCYIKDQEKKALSSQQTVTMMILLLLAVSIVIGQPTTKTTANDAASTTDTIGTTTLSTTATSLSSLSTLTTTATTDDCSSFVEVLTILPTTTTNNDRCNVVDLRVTLNQIDTLETYPDCYIS
jgi:hypothetical protein